ncbi:MAG: hypothetical protein QM308_01910 [Bacillota bacterium]|nr:hypothetical protein [Bacillota bacterium]
MYRLLLVTDHEDVREAFTSIQHLNRLMFEPVALARNVEEAEAFLYRPGADAIAIDPENRDFQALCQLMDEKYPCMPIMRTHRRGDGLRNELSMVREALDQLLGDFSDYDSTRPCAQARIQSDALHRLLEERIASRGELESRLLLARSKINISRPGLLFEFELPDGINFMENRWSHGFDRLDLALKANFFGQIPGPLQYTSALLSPMRLRVLACTTEDVTDEELDVLSAHAHQLVLGTAAQVKIYMDLDLVCTQFRVLPRLDSFIPLKD